MTKGIRREERQRKAGRKKYFAKYSNRKSLEVIIQARNNRTLKELANVNVAS